VKTLIIAAHPDDEVLGCGGTIARLAQEGHEAFIAILGEGITSRSTKRELVDQTLLDALHARSQQVAKFLGANDPFLYKLPDNRLDTLPFLDIVKIIEGLVERLLPQVIYTHHGGDLNIDHMIIHRATLTVTRPMVRCPVKELYAYEVPSSTEWSLGQFSPIFRPNVFMDIGATLENKIQAIQFYESEVQSFPHPRSPETIRAAARHWGSVAGLEAAEAFELVRSIR
jgi:LmbE family N-acetylglucosaminyl deacetylase